MAEFDFDELDDIEDDLPMLYQAKPEPEVKKTMLPEPTKPLLGEKDIKTLETAVKEAQKLTKSLETLDFQLEKFNKFEEKISSGKVKNTILLSITSMLAGGFIGNYAQSELNDYYINSQTQHISAQIRAKAGQVDELAKYGIKIGGTATSLQVFSIKNSKIRAWQNDQYSVLEYSKK